MALNDLPGGVSNPATMQQTAPQNASQATPDLSSLPSGNSPGSLLIWNTLHARLETCTYSSKPCVYHESLPSTRTCCPEQGLPCCPRTPGQGVACLDIRCPLAGTQRGLRSPEQPQAQLVTYSQPQVLFSAGSAPPQTLPAGTYLIQRTANATVYRPVLDTADVIVPAPTTVPAPPLYSPTKSCQRSKSLIVSSQLSH